MASFLYDKGAEKLLSAQVDFTSDNIGVALVADSYVPDQAADEFLDDIIAGDQIKLFSPMTTVTVSSGVVDGDDVIFTAAGGGGTPPTAAAVVFYKDTGVAATSALLVYHDDANGLPLLTNGGDITCTWANTANKILKL